MKKGNRLQKRLNLCAKVNLALDIVGVEPNGYHILDTIAVNIPVSDQIEVVVREDRSATVQYDNGVVYQNDTVIRAVQHMIDTYDLPGADVYIKKAIPVGAGLGGSSADAAGVIKCYLEIFDVVCDMDKLAEVGSDVPYMVFGGACRINGIGNIVKRVSVPLLYGVVLVDTAVKVDTRLAYSVYDKINGEHNSIDDFLAEKIPAFNALQRSAISINPQIGGLLDVLRVAGFENVVMSGSGGGVFGYASTRVTRDQCLAQLTKLICAKSMLLIPFDTERKNEEAEFGLSGLFV
ncbi:MAG: hypothetical protein LBE09_04035 [Christensenellaceae bacterium]|jgi:4-diphosphocytidyl-2-C-methyl-D-erythritol kinase|nr:hypothetical protein [Christensenellaceae bacterium]